MVAATPYDAYTLTVDGEPLRLFTTGRGRDAVLVVHGLLAAHQELTPLIDGLAGAGLTVLAPDLRGCGQSGGPRGHTSPGRALADVRAVVEWAHKRTFRLAGGVGHSLGAAYLVHMAAHGIAMPRLVLGAPPSTVRAEIGALEYAGYRAGAVINRLWMAAGQDPLRVPYKVGLADTIDDPDRRREAEALKFLQDTLPLSNVEPLLGVDTASWARRVTAPTLVLLAANERVVQHASSRAVYDALAGPKELRTIGGAHSMFLDAHRDEAIAAAVDWLKG